MNTGIIWKKKYTAISFADLQCLYNFRGFQGQMVKPQPELFVKGVSSGTLQPPKTPQDLR